MKKPPLPQSSLVSRMKPGAIGYEDERCDYLHQLCGWIEMKIREGLTARAAIRLAARHRRMRLFKHGHLSRPRLTMLLYRWRRNRSPEVFRRHYKPGKPRIPAALVSEFLNRLASDRVVTAAAVMRSLRADWLAGRSIPGLGTWAEYLHRLHGELASAAPPRFPFSNRTLVRCLGAGRPGAWQHRIIAALRAQRELERFTNFIEARRGELEARRSHEPLGTPWSQQK